MGRWLHLTAINCWFQLERFPRTKLVGGAMYFIVKSLISRIVKQVKIVKCSLMIPS